MKMPRLTRVTRETKESNMKNVFYIVSERGISFVKKCATAKSKAYFNAKFLLIVPILIFLQKTQSIHLNLQTIA